MAVDEYSIPAHVSKYLKDRGYEISTSMDSFITSWWHWYTGDEGWYETDYVTLDGKRKKRKRLSLHPARRVAREWASLLLTDSTEVSVDAEGANTYLNGYDADGRHVKGYLERHGFWAVSQELVERAFALGTGAWALWFDVRDDATTVIKPRTYDARMVVPLSWDDDGVTECAFCTRVVLKGKRADQLQMHVIDPETGNYAIETVVFIDAKPVSAELFDILPRFDTMCPTPTFGIVRPGIANTCADVSPFGMSVFADGLDTVKAVDLTWDAFMQEIELTGVMVFMDEKMIDVRDQNGKAVPVPRGQENRVFRKLFGETGRDLYEVFSPEIRADPLFRAFNTALAQLGDQCGFGAEYFTLDKNGGLKTATEVSSDNSALMRNIRKHEVVLGNAIEQLLGSLLTCARVHCGAPIEEEFGDVTVFFDDSIITDTQADKNQMMAEIAAGIAQPWEFRAKFYGESAEEAQAACAGPDVYGGFDLTE